MRQLTKYIQYTIIALLLPAVYACKGKPVDNVGKDSTMAALTPNSKPDAAKGPALSDEQTFRLFLKKFKDAVKAKRKTDLAAMFNFPLQTLPQWTNDELQSNRINTSGGLITESEFLQYFNDIFTADAVKLIPESGEDDLSEIDKTTTENYYLTLKQVTDKGCLLYEFEKQYPEDNGNETSFGFVFGKVKGAYKVISYYRPWPLK